MVTPHVYSGVIRGDFWRRIRGWRVVCRHGEACEGLASGEQARRCEQGAGEWCSGRER